MRNAVYCERLKIAQASQVRSLEPYYQAVCKTYITKNSKKVNLCYTINKREVRYDPGLPEWQCYYEKQWRYDYFTEIINKAKRSAEAIEVELYDKDNDSYYTKEYPVRRNSIIIVEGIFLQRKELDGIFDYMIYIDVPEAVRLGRVLDRDTYIGDRESITDKYENRYFPAEHRYCREYQPEKAADLVLSIS